MSQSLKIYTQPIVYAGLAIASAGLTVAGYLTGNKNPDLPMGVIFALGAGYMSVKTFGEARKISHILNFSQFDEI